MTNRNWYQDFGSFGSQVFGRVFIFDRRPQGGGWYKGTYVTFRGSVGGATTLGMAWRPVAGGLVIDYGFRRATYTVTGVNSPLELLGIRASDSGNTVWASTRSPYAPATVRRLFPR